MEGLQVKSVTLGGLLCFLPQRRQVLDVGFNGQRKHAAGSGVPEQVTELVPLRRQVVRVVIAGVDLTVYVEAEGVEQLAPREVVRIVAAFRGQG